MERPATPLEFDSAPSKRASRPQPWAVRASYALLALLMLILCAPLAITSGNALLSRLPEQQEGGGPRAALVGAFRGIKRVLEDEPPGRAELKRVYDDVRIRTLHSSPNPKVVVGADNWLFFMEPDSGLPTYVHDRPLAADEVAQWQRVIEQRVDFFAARGVTYLLVMAPSKSSIQGEHIPERIRQRSPFGRFDQIVAGLSHKAQAHVLDLRAPLREQALHTDNYFRLDSHWNEEGAYLAYSEMISRIATLATNAGRGLPMDWAKPVAVTRKRVRAERDDLASMLNHPHFMSEWVTALTPVGPEPTRFAVPMEQLSTLRDPKLPPSSNFYPYGRSAVGAETGHLPRCVAFRDSFFHIVEPYFARHCQRLILLKHLDKLQTPVLSLDMKVLASERPQVVVEEFVERLLNRSYALPPASLTAADSLAYPAPLEGQPLH